MKQYQSSRGRISLSVAVTAAGLILITLILFAVFRPKDKDPTPDPPTVPEKTVRPTPAPVAPPAEAPAPVPEKPLVPAEVPLSTEITERTHIGNITTSAAAAETHRALTADLIARLEQLADVHDIPKIKVATQELADRYYLLDRVVKLRNLDKPGSASVTSAHKESVERIIATWNINMEVANTVDRLFSERGLMNDEHVSFMLRRWMDEAP